MEAPIFAVTVYPDRARVTRRGRVRLAAGDQRVVVDALPLILRTDSLRVTGRGPATVLGVDVVTERHPTAPDETVRALTEEERTIQSEIAELDDADGVQAQLTTFLEQLARRSAGTYARTPERLTEFTETFTDRLSGVRTKRRELAERRREAAERLAAVERQLAAMTKQRAPDRVAAAVTLAVAEEADIELELSYVVGGAGWSSAYDVRLADGRLTLQWYGLVSQRTGENWPECDLTLSTARPAEAAKVPELDPWFLDRLRPPVPVGGPADRGPMMAAAGMGFAAAAPSAAQAESYDAAALDLYEAVATVEQGVAAASYRPARPVAVPADGDPHRATVAAIDLEAALDYVTAPVRSTDAHLRATVTNSSSHTFPAGMAAVFHEADFVGSAGLPVWAPGEEVELALGVDDRIRVERELTRRTASKATLGTARRREVEHTITATNHTPRPARVTVIDQLPVSRDHEINVKPVTVDPEPVERTDLGVLTWKLELAPGAEAKIRLGVRIDVGKGVELTGWRE